MTVEHNSELHPNFVVEVPVDIVVRFLLKKGVVTNESRVYMLFKVTNVTSGGHQKIKKITRG